MRKLIVLSSIVICLQWSNCVFADIHSVTIGRMSGDTSAAEFSTIIHFTAANDYQNWKFGFYMSRPFVSQQTFNQNLVMQICNASNACSSLTYQTASSMSLPDESAGYTTILAPSTPISLKKGQAYTIKLLHNNQWNPGNYSAVPQNFFIAANHTIYKLASNKNTYHLINYDQGSVDAEINSHITTDWYDSAPQTATGNSIVPAPVNYMADSGMYSLTDGMKIHNLLSTDNTTAEIFQKELIKNLNINTTVDNENANTGIIINKIAPSFINNNPEGYMIKIQTNSIIISAMNNTGVFYAFETLRQLMTQNPKQLQDATIVDYPRFKYRGILLDTARHYFTVKQIKRVIDLMAAHKLNTLHIHFADDEGFRLALPDYPMLTNIGAVRAYGQKIGPMMFLQGNLDITNVSQKPYPDAGHLYKGYYTQKDIHELISYANAHQITIIPEIDIPGHARALIKSLPNSFVDPNDASSFLSLGHTINDIDNAMDGESSFVSVQGYTDDVIPVCTYNSNISVGPQFTQDINAIINQIASLFSGQTTLYAHNNEISVGADEVSANAWTNDKSCQGDWANLTALEKSQKFFQMLADNHSSLLFSGWQQLVQNNDVSLGNDIVPASQVGHIYVWNVSNGGINQAVNLAKNGYPTVLAFADDTYFDLAYTPDINEPGFSWATQFSDTYSALSSAQSASATLNGIVDIAKKANIVGIEGTLWTENIPTFNHLIYMALPKMAGLAEASWSPASTTINYNNQLDWQSLAMRLGCGKTGFLAYLNKTYGIHYRGFPNGIYQEVPVGTLCLQ